jgi:hypothetical protein
VNHEILECRYLCGARFNVSLPGGSIDITQHEKLCAAVNMANAKQNEKDLTRFGDQINHPSHYTANRIEAIDVIDDWDLSFELGSVLKYIARHGKKDPTKTVEDLKKAAWYLNREIQKLEKRNE